MPPDKYGDSTYLRQGALDLLYPQFPWRQILAVIEGGYSVPRKVLSDRIDGVSLATVVTEEEIYHPWNFRGAQPILAAQSPRWTLGDTRGNVLPRIVYS